MAMEKLQRIPEQEWSPDQKSRYGGMCQLKDELADSRKAWREHSDRCGRLEDTFSHLQARLAENERLRIAILSHCQDARGILDIQGHIQVQGNIWRHISGQ